MMLIFMSDSNPRPEFFRRKKFLAVAVAEFHIVHTGFGQGLIDRTDKVVGKVVVINQSAVPDRAIQYLNLFSVHVRPFTNVI